MRHRHFFPAVTLWISSFLVLSLVGCAGSPSARFYLLSPTVTAKNEAVPPQQGNCITLRIARVTLPEYLNRPQIVTRTSENNLALSDYNLWAEPLTDTFARVLAENISRQICTQKIMLSPGKTPGGWESRIEVEVFGMDGTLGKEAVLEAWWSVSRGAETALSKRSRHSEPVNEKTYDALVRAQSRNIGALSREIAEAIRKTGMQ